MYFQYKTMSFRTFFTYFPLKKTSGNWCNITYSTSFLIEKVPRTLPISVRNNFRGETQCYFLTCFQKKKTNMYETYLLDKQKFTVMLKICKRQKSKVNTFLQFQNNIRKSLFLKLEYQSDHKLKCSIAKLLSKQKENFCRNFVFFSVTRVEENK